MAGYNHCCFVGNLGRDVELKYTQAGKAVANTVIAVNEKWGGEDHTEWVNLVLWERLAEVLAEYGKKGSQILVAGRLQTREWEDNDGNKRKTAEVLVRELKLLGGRQQAAEDRQPGDDNGVPF